MASSMPTYSLPQRLAAEAVGTLLLLATVIGSGIMGDSLAGGNVAIALLGNTLPTGAILYVLITMFGPISGAHFNPAVSLAFAIKGDISWREFGLFVLVQIVAAILGVWLAHAMFDQSILQLSVKQRTGMGQWISEGVATFGLVAAIFIAIKTNKDSVAWVVGLYITAAYWFTASTSFANPAVAISRCLSNTFAGIRPSDVLPFVVVQLVATMVAVLYCRWQLDDGQE
jgi:glycerol uptake facilitator-like aquaporin